MSNDTDPTPIRPAINKKELDDVSHELAESLQKSLPEDVSFALFIYRPDGSVKYISSGQLDDVDTIIERWRAKVFGGDHVKIGAKGAIANIRRLRMFLVNSEISSCKDDPEGIVDAAIARIREIKARYRADVPPGRRIL